MESRLPPSDHASERFQPRLQLRARFAPPAFTLELLQIRHREEQVVAVDDPAELRRLLFDATRQLASTDYATPDECTGPTKLPAGRMRAART